MVKASILDGVRRKAFCFSGEKILGSGNKKAPVDNG